MKIPVFPLNTVLFPESELQLRLFETRYLDMVRECLRTEVGFGICLIRKGKEADDVADFFSIGTYVNIIDWDHLNDGLLGITVKGKRRFKVKQSELRKDHLRIGEIDWLNEENALMPRAYQQFSDLLKEIAKQYKLPLVNEIERFKEARWVSDSLAECLPFEIPAKQTLLEMNNTLKRFDYMQSLLEKINAEERASS